MSKLDELLAQQEKLQKQIDDARAAEQTEALQQIAGICEKYKITYAQLKPVLTKQRKRRTKAEIAATNG